nr:glycosyltransferase [Anaerolineae bacterium]
AMACCMDNLCLSIVGGTIDETERENEELSRLKALGAELGLGSLVAFLGARSQDTLQYYYAAAEALIIPSHYESFGMVALEAMACGTPVIASEVGGLAYLIQDGLTGFHVPTNDPEELAGKIRLILTESDLRREMADAARVYARQFSWPNIAAEVQKVYDECLGLIAPPRYYSWPYGL